MRPCVGLNCLTLAYFNPYGLHTIEKGIEKYEHSTWWCQNI